MLEKFRATLSFIKNNPSFIHNYIIPDTKPLVSTYISLRRIYQLNDFFERKSLNSNYNLNKIPLNKGYLVKKNNSLKKKIHNLIKRISHFSNSLNWKDMQKKSKKPFLITYQLDLTEKKNFDILSLIMEKEIIGIISNYLKQIPVLLEAAIWYSPNNIFQKGKSQEFHLDSEDIKQIKLFLPIKNVTKNTGPLTIISKQETDKIYKNLKKTNCRKKFGYPIQNQKFNDNLIMQYKPKTIELTGDVGDIIFVDTCRCLHYGSRPKRNSQPRWLLSLHFTTSQSKELPLWGVKNYDAFKELNFKKFSKDYKNKVLNNLLRFYIANKKHNFYKHSY